MTGGRGRRRRIRDITRASDLQRDNNALVFVTWLYRYRYRVRLMIIIGVGSGHKSENFEIKDNRSIYSRRNYTHQRYQCTLCIRI